MLLSRRQLLSLGGAAGIGWLASRLPLASALAAGGSLSARAIPRGDQRIALISDLNASYGSTHYGETVHRGVSLLRQLQVDLVLCAGDMVAGQKLGLSASQLDGMWSAFQRHVLQPLRGAGEPFAPAMGNHDASSGRGPAGYTFALDRQRAARFWRSQQTALGLQFVDADRFPFRYSIRQGDLFALVLDASSASVDAGDWAWAAQQLASGSARQARLRLVMGHLPAYAVSQGRDRPGEVLHQPERLRQLLAPQGAHLYVSGHQHAWFPARVGDTQLLNLGAMGSGPRRLLGSSAPAVQTLTLLDLFRDRNLVVETTVELQGMQVLDSTRLPANLQPSLGPRLERRSGPIQLKPG